MPETPSTRFSLLVRLSDEQDERAWAEFVEIYAPMIVRLARGKGLQNADVEDLTQDVFRAVASAVNRGAYDPARGSFRAWLFTIARNLLINLLADQRRRPRVTGGADVARLLEELPAPAAEESVLFDGEYRRRLFAWAAEQVRGEFRAVTWRAFWLTAVEGKPAREVAATLGVSVGAVHQCKSRVMVRLRRRIEQVGGES